MTIDSSKMCFGLSEDLDKESFSCFLQLAGRAQFAESLAARLSSDEIDECVSFLMGLIVKHLSEDEYHSLFLCDRDHSHGKKSHE
jgi:hypothetical protein